MKTSLALSTKRILAASVLAGCGAMAFGQAAPAPAAGPQGGPPPQHRMQPGQPGGPRFDPAKFAEMRAKHQAEREAALKARLKITPQQEGAFNAFTAAMRPPANRPQFDRAEFAKLTTPQRIDRMQQMKAQRDAEMAKRGDATKAFYAQLTPYQQGVFDAMPHGHRGHGDHGPRHGGPGFERGGQPPMKG